MPQPPALTLEASPESPERTKLYRRAQQALGEEGYPLFLQYVEGLSSCYGDRFQ